MGSMSKRTGYFANFPRSRNFKDLGNEEIARAVALISAIARAKRPLTKQLWKK